MIENDSQRCFIQAESVYYMVTLQQKKRWIFLIDKRFLLGKTCNWEKQLPCGFFICGQELLHGYDHSKAGGHVLHGYFPQRRPSI